MLDDINFKAKHHQLSELFIMVKGENYLIRHKDMTTINVWDLQTEPKPQEAETHQIWEGNWFQLHSPYLT